MSYSDPAPARAQKIATALADAFIASNLDKRFEANAYAKTFLEDQLKQLKLRLQDSEKIMLEFAEEQIVETREKSSIAENNLAARTLRWEISSPSASRTSSCGSRLHRQTPSTCRSCCQTRSSTVCATSATRS